MMWVVRGEISDDAGMKGLMVRIGSGGVFNLLWRTLCVDSMRVSVDRLVRSNGLVLCRVSPDCRCGVNIWVERLPNIGRQLYLAPAFIGGVGISMGVSLTEIRSSLWDGEGVQLIAVLRSSAVIRSDDLVGEDSSLASTSINHNHNRLDQFSTPVFLYSFTQTTDDYCDTKWRRKGNRSIFLSTPQYLLLRLLQHLSSTSLTAYATMHTKMCGIHFLLHMLPCLQRCVESTSW